MDPDIHCCDIWTCVQRTAVLRLTWHHLHAATELWYTRLSEVPLPDGLVRCRERKNLKNTMKRHEGNGTRSVGTPLKVTWLYYFPLAHDVTAGGGHAGWIEALIQAPSWWIRLSMAGTGQCCWSAQRPKIRLGHPRQAATMTLALDGGTGHTRGAPMPELQRRPWTCMGSPGASPSHRPACAGTRWCRPRPWHGCWTSP